MYPLIGIGVLTVLFFGLLGSAMGRYKRCPSNRVLVIYGKTGRNSAGQSRAARCIHGGAAFVWPMLQAYEFLDLEPRQISIDLLDALSKQNIRVSIPSVFTIAISTEEEVMNNAAERLLGLNDQQIKQMAEEIITGQLRAVIAQMTIEEINGDRDKFVSSVTADVEKELKKIGLKLLNVNIKDIKDAAGYIQALGQEASTKAINEALVKVAENTRMGEIGKANAQRDQAISVADATRERDVKVAEAGAATAAGKAKADQEQRVAVAGANAEATRGENAAKVTIADSDAQRREQVAEASRRGTSAELTKKAEAEAAGYQAETTAQEARALQEAARLKAEIVVPADADRQKVEIEAEAAKIKTIKAAEAEGAAIRVRMEGEAQGIKAKLLAQAEGYKKIIDETGGVDAFLRLQIGQNLVAIIQELSKMMTGLKPDKVVVWQGGEGTGTSAFIKDLFASIPALTDLFKAVGMELPFDLSKMTGDPEKSTETAGKPGSEEHHPAAKA